MTSSGEALAKHYRALGDFKNDFRNYNLMGLLCSLVRGPSVFDIGCGSGLFLEMLERDGKKAVGLEPNDELITLARKRNAGLRIIKGSAEDLDKLSPGRVDSATMVDVLEHIRDDAGHLKKIAAVLNDSGRLILVVPAYQILYGTRDRLYGHERRYSKKDLSRKLGEAGFKVVNVRYWNMLGVLPYFFYEKILGRPLEVRLRSNKNRNVVQGFIHKLLDLWFKYVENKINFGFGLSLVCVAEKV